MKQQEMLMMLNDERFHGDALWLQSLNVMVTLTISSCYVTGHPFKTLDFHTGNVFDMLQHTRNHDNITIVVLEIQIVLLGPELFREPESGGFNHEYLQVRAATKENI